MSKADPYVITQPGENLSQIMADARGNDAALRAHPGNADHFGPGRAQNEALDPGDVIFRVVRPPDAAPVKLEDANDLLATLPKTKLRITVKNAKGAPEKEGVEYRLTVTPKGGQPFYFEGTIGANGVIEREVPTGLYALHWDRLSIRYQLHTKEGTATCDMLAAARNRIFEPTSYAAVEREASASIDEETVDFSDGESLMEEDDAVGQDTTHVHHYLARKIAGLRIEANATFGTSSPGLWDNRWTALRPLLVPKFPLPRRDDTSIELAQRRYREAASPLKVTSPRANEEHAEVASVGPWYNAAHNKMALLGHHPPPLEESNSFTTLATAANKRLVRLWMAEVLAAVPESERGVVRRWFASGDGREHFKNWCGHVTTIGHKMKTGEHRAGHAIDIDMHFNPWCPVYSSELARMIGEPIGKTSDSSRSPSFGRVFDRALRLFVAPQGVADDPKKRDPTAVFFAEKYYRNPWDWRPDTLRDTLGALQAWNWAMVAYFHYVYGRAHAIKPTYVDHSYVDACRGPVNGGAALWRELVSDFNRGDGLVHPHASLIFEQPPPPIGPFRRPTPPGNDPNKTKPEVVEATELHYPFGKQRVWKATLGELIAAAKTDDEMTQLGDAFQQQVVRDHAQVMKPELGTRDPCRGVYNLSYDVALAFGRAFSHAGEYRLLRMLSFGRNPAASGGDFMHIDYDSYHFDSNNRPGGRTMRELDFMKVTFGGQPADPRRPWTGKAGVQVRVAATREQVFPSFSSKDITSSIVPDKYDPNVCVFEWNNDHWDLVLVGPGTCVVYLTHSTPSLVDASYEITVTQ